MSAYCTVQQLRDEGVADPPDDTRLEDLIADASAYIDLVTGMWFEERTLTLKVDGNGVRTLHLYIPIRTITEVRLDGEVVDAALYTVYNRVFPDDRPNPRIAYERVRQGPNIFRDEEFPLERRWKRGEQNVELDGVFGYVDTNPDGTNPHIPLQLVRACKRLVIRALPFLGDTSSVTTAITTGPGQLTKETTDGHSYSVQSTGAQQINTVSTRTVYGLTGDTDIDNVLLKYQAKRPRFMGVA